MRSTAAAASAASFSLLVSVSVGDRYVVAGGSQIRFLLGRWHCGGRKRRCGAHGISFVLRSEKKSLVVIFDNVVIPKSKNMVKRSMASFSKNPAILFTMFRRGSISDPATVEHAA
jgi:hypothetical protein